jgi:hypothetical protein
MNPSETPRQIVNCRLSIRDLLALREDSGNSIAVMALPRNPAGGSYGPTTGNPVLYPPGTEQSRPTVRSLTPFDPFFNLPFYQKREDLPIQNTNDASVPLAKNNMDTSVHQTLYAQGLEMRKKVVGEDYVANALEKGSGDFTRPLQQFATVFTVLLLLSLFPPLLSLHGNMADHG